MATFDTGPTFDAPAPPPTFDRVDPGSVYTYNGLSTDTSTIVVVGQEGLDEMPDVRSADVGYPQSDGLLGGLDLLGGRTITLSLALLGTAAKPVPVLLDQVKAAFSPAQSSNRPLTFDWPGLYQRQVYCRPRKLTSSLVGRITDGAALPVIQLVAADPRIYDAQPAPVTGAAGTWITANNAGNWTTWPVVTVSGAVTNPQIINNTTGATLTVTRTLGASDVLVVDMGARTATLNGVSVRANMALVPGWWPLPPGVSQVGVQGTGVAATVQVSFASAWL